MPPVPSRCSRNRSSSIATQRPALAAALAYLRKGDALAVTKPDRLALNTADLLKIERYGSARGIGLIVLSMGGERFDTRNPTSRLILTILAGVATWGREIMLERQREGIAKAKAEGKYRGRRPSVDRNQVRAMLADGKGPTEIARRPSGDPPQHRLRGRCRLAGWGWWWRRVVHARGGFVQSRREPRSPELPADTPPGQAPRRRRLRCPLARRQCGPARNPVPGRGQTARTADLFQRGRPGYRPGARCWCRRRRRWRRGSWCGRKQPGASPAAVRPVTGSPSLGHRVSATDRIAVHRRLPECGTVQPRRDGVGDDPADAGVKCHRLAVERSGGEVEDPSERRGERHGLGDTAGVRCDVVHQLSAGHPHASGNTVAPFPARPGRQRPPSTPPLCGASDRRDMT